MEEKIRISILLEIYGNLLTKKQYEFMDYYFNQDLSLSEIADNNDITRQAVNTILTKCKKKLEKYEKDLKFMKKQEIIKQEVEELKNTEINEKQIKHIKNIEKSLDF